MKTSCQLALVCAALVGVASCFGDNEGSDGPQVLEVAAPLTVDAEGGVSALTVRVHGKAQDQLTVELTGGTLGTYAPERATVITDLAGDAEITATFTAGAASGTEAATAQVFDAAGARGSRRFSFAITPITRVGQATQFAATDPADLTSLEGQAIAITEAGNLRRLGILAPSAVEVVVGLYAETAGVPGALVAQATATLKPGLNELPVPNVAVQPGTYWFMANYKTATNLYVSTTTVPTRWTARNYSAGIPATYPNTNLPYNDLLRNYYLVFGQ